MEVSFYYERYRFYVPADINLGDVNIPVSLGTTGSAAASSGIATSTSVGPTGLGGATLTVLSSATGSVGYI
jgi:hypothetical protein